MNIVHCQSQSEGVTRAMGSKFATQLITGGTILLHGELGAGKTTFVQGMAEGLGITSSVTSPTFNLLSEYPVTHHPVIHRLVHIDLYRTYGPEDIISLDVHSYQADPGTLVVVEWPERAPSVWDHVLGTIQFEAHELHHHELSISGDIVPFFNNTK